MKILSGALLVMLTLGLISPAQADDTTTPAPPTMLVFGDSITAMYNNVAGDPMQGWWSMVAAKRGLVPVTDAASGSGMLKRGGCTSSTFGERLGKIATVKPSIILVEGGRNDYLTCKHGKYLVASKSMSKLAIEKYMHDLAVKVKAVHFSKKHVFVMTPWFSKRREYSYIRSYVKASAIKHGFTWIPTGLFSGGLSLDGTHPNTAGSAEIARRVLTRSTLGR